LCEPASRAVAPYRERTMKRIMLAVPVVALVGVLAVGLAAAQTPPTTAVLVCRLAAGSSTPQDVNLRVDYEGQTVNGIPAQISEGEIRFERSGGQFTFSVKVNTYTGRLGGTATDEGYTSPLSGECVPAQERKF
jgi:hypothetical protein